MKPVKINNVLKHTSGLVTEGKLILMSGMIPSNGELKQVLFELDGKLPIVVSEDELFEENDLIYDVDVKKLTRATALQVKVKEGGANYYQKVIVTPTRFSPEQLRAIVTHQLFHDDRVLVECEGERYTDPECPIAIGGRYEYWIKLDPSNFVTMFKVKKKEKMLPMDKVKIACERAFHAIITLPGDTTLFSEWWKEHEKWFEQNVK